MSYDMSWQLVTMVVLMTTTATLLPMGYTAVDRLGHPLVCSNDGGCQYLEPHLHILGSSCVLLSGLTRVWTKPWLVVTSVR